MVGVWPWRTNRTSVVGGACEPVVSACHGRVANLPSASWIRSHRSRAGDRGLPGLPAAGGLAGAGGGREAGRLRRRGLLGPAGARLRRPGRLGRSSSAWRRRPTAATAPGGCSPATARATGCSGPCGAPAWPTSRRARAATTACVLHGRLHRRRRAVRAAGQQAHARRARPLPAVPRARAGAARATLRVVVCLGAFAYEVVAPLLGVRPRPRFGHGVEVDARAGPDDRRCARSTRASRTPSPASSPSRCSTPSSPGRPTLAGLSQTPEGLASAAAASATAGLAVRASSAPRREEAVDLAVVAVQRGRHAPAGQLGARRPRPRRGAGSNSAVITRAGGSRVQSVVVQRRQAQVVAVGAGAVEVVARRTTPSTPFVRK